MYFDHIYSHKPFLSPHYSLRSSSSFSCLILLPLSLPYLPLPSPSSSPLFSLSSLWPTDFSWCCLQEHGWGVIYRNMGTLPVRYHWRGPVFFDKHRLHWRGWWNGCCMYCPTRAGTVVSWQLPSAEHPHRAAACHTDTLALNSHVTGQFLRLLIFCGLRFYEHGRAL